MAVEKVTSASNTGQISISDIVQVKLRQNTVLAGIFRDLSVFASPGDKAVSFPRRSNNFSVQKLSGAQKGDDQESTFALDQLNLDQEAHIQWVIKKFDQARAKVRILEESIDEAVYQHAVSLDSDLFSEMDDNVAAGNIITPAALSQDNIVDMITQANTIRMPRQNRAWIFGNDAYGSLLKIDGFVDASKSNLDIVRSGMIGTLYGIPVFESDSATTGTRYLVHQDAVGYALGAAPELEDQKAIEYGTGSRRWVMDQMYGYKSLNAGNLVIKQAAS
jgi:hypothetical protein